MITTPALLEQCIIGSCCIEARDEMVPREAPPTEPRGVVKMEGAMSSSLSEKRLEWEKARVLITGREDFKSSSSSFFLLLLFSYRGSLCGVPKAKEFFFCLSGVFGTR